MTGEAVIHHDEGTPWDGIFRSPILGLSYLGLTGGVRRKMSEYGECVSFVNVVELYDVASAALVEGWLPLRGHELVFLRKHMDLTQDELATIIGSSRATVARWEFRGKPSQAAQPAAGLALPNWADFSIRMLVAAHLGLTGMADLAKAPGWRRGRLPPGEQRNLILHHDGSRWAVSASTLGAGGN